MQHNALLVQRFQQQADVEYQELLGRCHDFQAELAAERAKGNLTFAELDENETELTKLRSWLAKIGERDWFDAPRDIGWSGARAMHPEFSALQ
ncbi:MAG TPA: Chromate resistance protein ChrB [Roseiflexaceae bacterium]|nr:Chromate resistance protein ChrB [Roseiflexaceae bacterium]